jgi:hypothetical protein
MPGMTSLGLRYPFPWETVSAQSYQDLAEDIDGVLDGLDLLRTQARVPEMAIVSWSGAGTSVTQGVTTTMTYAFEQVDTANLANLGVNNDRLTLSAGIWLINAYVSITGGTTTSGTQLQFHLNTALHSFHRIDNSNFPSKEINGQTLMYVPVDGAILQVNGAWFGTGGPQTWFPFVQAWKIREL